MSKNTFSLGAVFACALIGAFSGMAHASTIIAYGSSAIPIDISNGTPPSTIQLLGTQNNSFAAPGTFSQGLEFNSGYDGVGGPIPFSASELFDVDGVFNTVILTGTMDVSSTTFPDSITINGGTPVQFGNLTLTVVGQTFLDNAPFPGGVLIGEQDFTVAAAVPETATWAMMVVGFLGVGFLAYRRQAGSPLRLV